MTENISTWGIGRLTMASTPTTPVQNSRIRGLVDRIMGVERHEALETVQYSRGQLESLGFKIVALDGHFYRAQLPAGYTTKMDLFDENGFALEVFDPSGRRRVRQESDPADPRGNPPVVLIYQ